MSWQYRIPQQAGSPWAANESNMRPPEFTEWPLIGIYCAHESPHDWLLGSFEASLDVFTETGELFWGWHREYLTGAGELIRLTSPRRRDPAHQLIVDDAPATEGTRAAAAESAGHDVRTRIKMRCGTCRLSRVVRSDTVQPFLTALWRLDTREIDLETFGRGVDRA